MISWHTEFHLVSKDAGEKLAAAIAAFASSHTFFMESNPCLDHSGQESP